MSKNVVILFFPFVDSDRDRFSTDRKRKLYANMPWALLYLERVIRDLDVEVILIDERLDQDYINIILKNRERILFAGVSSLIGQQFERGIMFSEIVKKHTNAPVIWGGWGATIFPEALLKEGYADYVCIGQGEVLIRKFTERMLTNEDVSDIAGIGYMKNGELIFNQYDKLANPELFPKVNLDLIDINKLIDINEKIPIGKRSIDYIATWGCPNKCAFCCMVRVSGGRWYSKKIDLIIEELKYLKKTASISYVTFWDDNIFANKKFILDFCHELINSEISILWGGFAHIGYFLKNYNEDDIRLIYKAGCREIRFGAESGDQDTLDYIHKKFKVNDILETVKLLKGFKLNTLLFFIACFPYKPDIDFWKSLNIIGKALLLDPKLDIKIRFFMPLPKTELFKDSVEKGFITPLTIKDLLSFFLQSVSLDYNGPWVKKNYIKKLEQYIEFYFLFTNPYFYKSFPLKIRPFVFLLNMFMYPIVYLRIHLNFMKFPIEAWIFAKLFPYKNYHKTGTPF